MPARSQIKRQNRITGLQQQEKHRQIGLRARMWLHIGIGAIIELLGPVNRRLLHDIHIFTAAMKPVAGIALKGLVGHHMAQRIQHRAADDVFRRDQLNLVPLALGLMAQGIGNQRINLRYGAVEMIRHRASPEARWRACSPSLQRPVRSSQVRRQNRGCNRGQGRDPYPPRARNR